MGPCKALAHMRAAGIREGPEGTGEFTRGRDKEKSCQEPRQRTGKGPPRHWETMAGGGIGDVSILEGSSYYPEDWQSSDRHRKGAWIAGLEREGMSRKFTFFLEY